MDPLQTPVSKVIDAFLRKIDDFKMLEYSDEDIDEDAKGYLTVAVANFEEISGETLEIDADGEYFTQELSNKIIDILALGMVVEWLKPIIYKADAMHNVMNLKDATFFSPAKIMEQKQMIYSTATSEYNKAVINYTFNHGSMEDYVL